MDLKAINILIFVVYPKEIAHDSYDLKPYKLLSSKIDFQQNMRAQFFLLLVLYYFFFVKKEFVKSSNSFLCSFKQISTVIPVESSSTMRQLSTI